MLASIDRALCRMYGIISGSSDELEIMLEIFGSAPWQQRLLIQQRHTLGSEDTPGIFCGRISCRTHTYLVFEQYHCLAPSQ